MTPRFDSGDHTIAPPCSASVAKSPGLSAARWMPASDVAIALSPLGDWTDEPFAYDARGKPCAPVLERSVVVSLYTWR